MLRNVLRQHPALACPEETQFYRQGWPYGTPEYWNFLKHNPTFIKHRAMDGVSEEEFDLIHAQSSSRRVMMTRYMKLFLSRKKPRAKSWFDKSPQNVYGLALLAQDFPDAKFVHIVRNPVDVVSSLKAGKVIKATVLGACNYWNEAVGIVQAMRPALGRRLMEVRYEDLCDRSERTLRSLMRFLDVPQYNFENLNIRHKSYADQPILTVTELMQVRELCQDRAALYQYGLGPNTAELLTTTGLIDLDSGASQPSAT